MRLLKLRKQLSHIGLLLVKHGDGFRVCDDAVRTPVDLDFRTLEDVEQWIRDQRHANRLIEADDAQFKVFVEDWRDVKCLGCEQTHPNRWWKENDDRCPSCGEGQVI